MKYKKVISAKFLDRPNRFIAKVEIDGKTEVVHVKNTGRCRELLIKNADVYLSFEDGANRKTKYDLIAVEKEIGKGRHMLVNIDSQVVNGVAEEWLKSGKLFSENAIIKREVTYGKSRFDFFIKDGENEAFLEVKGVTLENNGIASFPDAPTERGIKHLMELCDCVKNGYNGYILFVIQMKGIDHFEPNSTIHKNFVDALKKAKDCGVKILCIDCIVMPDEIIPGDYVPVKI
jgi:sugar fermentation stimulation protein A